MKRPAEIVVSEAEWEKLWTEGCNQVRLWLKRGSPNEEFKIEHALRMMQRIKGRAEGTFNGAIGNMWEPEPPTAQATEKGEG